MWRKQRCRQVQARTGSGRTRRPRREVQPLWDSLEVSHGAKWSPRVHVQTRTWVSRGFIQSRQNLGATKMSFSGRRPSALWSIQTTEHDLDLEANELSSRGKTRRSRKPRDEGQEADLRRPHAVIPSRRRSGEGRAMDSVVRDRVSRCGPEGREGGTVEHRGRQGRETFAGRGDGHVSCICQNP